MAGCSITYLGQYKIFTNTFYSYCYRLTITLSNPFTSNYYSSLSVMCSESAIGSPISGTSNSPAGTVAVMINAGQSITLSINGEQAIPMLYNVTSNSFILEVPINYSPAYITVLSVDKNNGYYWSLSPAGTVPSGQSPYNYFLNGGASARPAKFYWTYPKTQGGAFNLKAAEWNGLLSNINLVRAYKGLSTYPFTFVSTGNTFTAGHYNAAVAAIKDVSGYGGWLNYVNTGQTVTAQMMNVLVSELNAIP